MTRGGKNSGEASARSGQRRPESSRKLASRQKLDMEGQESGNDEVVGVKDRSGTEERGKSPQKLINKIYA